MTVNAFTLKTIFHESLAESLFNEILSRRSNYYYFLGKTLEWPNPGNPDPPNDTQDYEYFVRNYLLCVKRINFRDVSFVTRRINWVSGTVYDQFDGSYSSNFPSYSGATRLKDANFYVLTSQFNVYKCLFNNNNAQSTVEPSFFDPTTIETSDGYVWKYLYTIPLSQRNKFLTDEYMPVQKAVNNSYYSNGEIDSITITNRGTGYLGNSDTTLTVVGQFLDGILSGNISNVGIDYYANVVSNTTANIHTTGVFQPITYATAVLEFSNNLLSNIIITEPGLGYNADVKANTTITITTSGNIQPTANATANLNFQIDYFGIANLTPVLNNQGQIIDVKIINPGNNYKSASVVVNDTFGTGRSFFEHVHNVQIVNPGSGYYDNVAANTTVTIRTTGSLQPDSNAFANLFYSNNSIVGIEIINGGTGYDPNVAANTTATITTTGSIQPTVNATVQLNYQSGAEIFPELRNGQIERVYIEDPGIGYSSNTQTTIIVEGDGTGAQLVPYVNTSGEIEDVIISSRGSGYTYADIFFYGDGSNANAIVNLSSNDLDTLQTVVELSAVKGGLHAFRVHSPGDSYTYANIIVEGDGANFGGNVVLYNNGVNYITVENPGSGYTHANVIIDGDGANANVTAIIAPNYRGHGSDPVKELFADALMFTSTINNQPVFDKQVTNDFRQFGIIKDVLNNNNDQLFSNVGGVACYLITLGGTSGITKDLILTHTVLGVKKYFVVNELYTDTNQILVTNLNNYEINQGDIFVDETTLVEYNVVTIDKYPEINKFSGRMLFIDNRTAVSQSDQQLVTLRTVIKL